MLSVVLAGFSEKRWLSLNKLSGVALDRADRLAPAAQVFGKV
jgi:hypothetical protein